MRDVIFIANNDWHGLWFQRQEFATRLALRGHRVWYLNRTLQRWPTYHHLKQRLNKQTFEMNNGISRPTELRIVTPFWLPPTAWLRPLNSLLVRRTFKAIPLKTFPVLIAYVPTYNTLEVIRQVIPGLVVYINVHNYDADSVLSDLLVSERILIRQSDILLADSVYNRERLSRIGGSRSVFPSEPGVDFESFHTAFRGDEAKRGRSVCYFGGIGPHLDLELYDDLTRAYDVFFVGVVSPALRNKLPASIRILPPVNNRALPQIIREADVLAIFYKNSPYVDGVIPAKFYECLATGKPLLVSGLRGLDDHLGTFYDVQGDTEKTLSVLAALTDTETADIELRWI